jgi:3'(2'), 5'-bisphosphate nucleotidase
MFEDEFLAMIAAVKEANIVVKEIYEKGFDVKIKEDDSPVTTADIASNKIIRKHLGVFDKIAWLSEEDNDNLDRLTNDLVFVVDPLDGTLDFVNHDGTFGINIALVYKHEPILSVIGFPAWNSFAYAIKGKGSFYVDSKDKTTRLHVSNRTKDLIFIGSKTHFLDSEKELIAKNKDLIKEVVTSGASTKALMLARGDADVSIRFTKETKEWDTCAPDLLIKEAGGVFLDTKLNEIKYNREDVYNRDGYCMFNRIENTCLLK